MALLGTATVDATAPPRGAPPAQGAAAAAAAQPGAARGVSCDVRCAQIASPLFAAEWKEHTQSWAQLCRGRACRDCDECSDLVA